MLNIDDTYEIFINNNLYLATYKGDYMGRAGWCDSCSGNNYHRKERKTLLYRFDTADEIINLCQFCMKKLIGSDNNGYRWNKYIRGRAICKEWIW